MTPKPDDASQVAQYIQDLQHPMKVSIESLREIIKSVHPEIKERIKWNAPSYHLAGVDFLTFGPPARKQDELLLVFHHPEIVNIADEILEGKYKDRRLITIKSSDVLSLKEEAIKNIIEKLVEKINLIDSTKS